MSPIYLGLVYVVLVGCLNMSPSFRMHEVLLLVPHDVLKLVSVVFRSPGTTSLFELRGVLECPHPPEDLSLRRITIFCVRSRSLSLHAHPPIDSYLRSMTDLISLSHYLIVSLSRHDSERYL